jgi:hypothetical protein
VAVSTERMPPQPDRRADLLDDFSGTRLRSDLWVDHYLPHWTTAERSRARYDLSELGLRLRIDADQPTWRPEDAPMRVSSIQTADGSGPIGSANGIHRHRPDGLVVRSVRPNVEHWTPSSGRVEVTVSASRDAGCMTAAWLVGIGQDAGGATGEICLFEIDAEGISATSSRARTGIKAHGDPALTTDMAEVVVPLDASRPHTWTAQWGAGRTIIGCDGVVVRRLEQAPRYPLMLLIDLFETDAGVGRHPKSALLHGVRGWGS